MSEGFVYFIKEDDTGNVKIGFSSQHPKNRLKELQTGNSSQLSLIGYVDGDQYLEKELHNIFWKDRTRDSGEWFKMSPLLKEKIQSLLKEQSENINNKIFEFKYQKQNKEQRIFVESNQTPENQNISNDQHNIDNFNVISFELALFSERFKLVSEFIRFAENKFKTNYKTKSIDGIHSLRCAYDLIYLNKESEFIEQKRIGRFDINITPIPGVKISDILKEQEPEWKWDNCNWSTLLGEKIIFNNEIIELFFNHEEWYMGQFKKHKEYHKTFLQKLF